MSCKFIWYNLPKQIKDKLGINDGKGWSNIPKRVNNLLDTLKTDKPTCYSTLFPKGHNILWHDLPNRLEKVCELVNCEEPSLINFDVEADWESIGITDADSFLSRILEGDYFSADDIIENVSNFSLVENRLRCTLEPANFIARMGDFNLTKINSFVSSSGSLIINNAGLSSFNELGDIYETVESLDIESNLFTTLYIPDTFINLSSLEMENNPLTTITRFPLFPNLTAFNLFRNAFTTEEFDKLNDWALIAPDNGEMDASNNTDDFSDSITYTTLINKGWTITT
jgi:hypothetical protein